MRRKLLMIAVPAAGAVAVVAMAASALAASSPAGSAARTVALSSPAPATSQAQAEQAALTYVTAHYPGSGTARVVTSHASGEHGQGAYEVRAVAPDGKTYEVYVSQATGAVLKASPEGSGSGHGDDSSGDDSRGDDSRGDDSHSPGTGHHDDSPDHRDDSASHGGHPDH